MATGRIKYDYSLHRNGIIHMYNDTIYQNDTDFTNALKHRNVITVFQISDNTKIMHLLNRINAGYAWGISGDSVTWSNHPEILLFCSTGLWVGQLDLTTTPYSIITLNKATLTSI